MIFGSGLSKYLIENLFYTSNRSEVNKVSLEPKEYLSRKKASFSFLSFFICKCIRREDKDLIEKANERIEKQLDIVKYLRSSLIHRVQRNLVLTLGERHLLRNQINPFVLDAHEKKDRKNKEDKQDEAGSSSESEEFDPSYVKNEDRSKLYNDLYAGAFQLEYEEDFRGT